MEKINELDQSPKIVQKTPLKELKGMNENITLTTSYSAKDISSKSSQKKSYNEINDVRMVSPCKRVKFLIIE